MDAPEMSAHNNDESSTTNHSESRENQAPVPSFTADKEHSLNNGSASQQPFAERKEAVAETNVMHAPTEKLQEPADELDTTTELNASKDDQAQQHEHIEDNFLAAPESVGESEQYVKNDVAREPLSSESIEPSTSEGVAQGNNNTETQQEEGQEMRESESDQSSSDFSMATQPETEKEDDVAAPIFKDAGDEGEAAAAPVDNRKPPPPVLHAPPVGELICLDDDSDDEDEEAAPVEGENEREPKRQKVVEAPATATALPLVRKPPGLGAIMSHQNRKIPQWMKDSVAVQRPLPSSNAVIPGQALGRHVPQVTAGPRAFPPHNFRPPYGALPFTSAPVTEMPEYFALPPDFKPSWQNILPPPIKVPRTSVANDRQPKAYQLSLLNVNEFTISGLPISYDARPTSVSGLRVPIRQISRPYGKAVYVQDKEEGGGKWRIPLEAYQAFYGYLVTLPRCRVVGIAPRLLDIASLERARQEKGYPTSEALVERGVPKGLSVALAPFQRGGVDFVLERKGRALIADDMGLGKTIQAIGAMSCYRDQWPILVLTPSSARYHWENEFQKWMGVKSEVNKPPDDESTGPDSYSWNGKLLNDWQINVVSASKDKLFPHPDTMIVICTYAIASVLAENKTIYPGLFRCAIVDESHMLKNKTSKRTSMLTPVLAAAKRCILLSGTPALARPAELWPQLQILHAEEHNWWNTEDEFHDKYVKRGGSRENAELHTMLTSTIMIRRLKDDILKTLPRKHRAMASLHVLSKEKSTEFKGLLEQLRQGKGKLGELAREHHAESLNRQETAGDGESDALVPGQIGMFSTEFMDQIKALDLDLRQRFEEGRQHIRVLLAPQIAHLDAERQSAVLLQSEGQLYADLERTRRERLAQIAADTANENESKRNVLSQLYCLSGEVKIPVVVDLLNRWLRDPTKGKLCIFAHHISVLNAIRDLSELSNDSESTQKYIRIDGSTNPLSRQEQINAFQTDPLVKVALLGITAAGVAVTLTASSTVWFAELFWTPAIVIQAEDRVHRIGQNSRVTCMYFVAKGTLDEVLWKLIEKKFRDLGEFVEGREKLKLVVETHYETLKELHSMFETSLKSDEDDDGEADDECSESDFEKLAQELQFDASLVHDFEVLGEEEQKMLSLDGDDVDGDSDDVKMPAVDTREVAGATVDEAICLDDSDDDEPHDRKVRSKAVSLEGSAESSPEGQAIGTCSNHGAGVCLDNQTAVSQTRVASYPDLTNCRVYRITMGGPSRPTLGLQMCLHEGRVVVSRVMPDRVDHLGQPVLKPSVGDILVSFGGHVIPELGLDQFAVVCQGIRQGLTTTPADAIFAEDEQFAQQFATIAEKKKQAELARRKAELAKKNSEAACNVIDIDD